MHVVEVFGVLGCRQLEAQPVRDAPNASLRRLLHCLVMTRMPEFVAVPLGVPARPRKLALI